MRTGVYQRIILNLEMVGMQYVKGFSSWIM